MIAVVYMSVYDMEASYQYPLSLPPAYVLFALVIETPVFKIVFLCSSRAGCSTSPCSVQYSVGPEDVYITLYLLFRLQWLLFRFVVVVDIISLTRHPKGLQIQTLQNFCLLSPCAALPDV